MITSINEFREISEKKKKNKLSKADNAFISDKIKTLMDEGRSQDQAIAMAYSYLERSKKKKSKKNESLVNEASTYDDFNKIVDIKKLEQIAHGIQLICAGEYGYTYINPTQNKIAINLGDGNPFAKYDTLEWWIEEITYIDYTKGKELINIEIDCEWVPGHGDDGWMMYNIKKGVFVTAQ